MANGYGSAARVTAAENLKNNTPVTDYVSGMDQPDTPPTPAGLSDSDKARLSSIAASHGVSGEALDQLAVIVEEFMAGAVPEDADVAPEGDVPVEEEADMPEEEM